MDTGGHNDEQAIRQLITAWMKASKSGDIDAVLDLMSDDVVFLQPGQTPMIGKAAFASASKSPPGRERPQFDGNSEIEEIKVLGDWAYMWTRLTVVVTPPGGGEQAIRSGHTLSVLKKENGKWLLARDANMLSPMTKPKA